MKKLIALIPTGGKTEEEIMESINRNPELQKIFRENELRKKPFYKIKKFLKFLEQTTSKFVL